MAKVLEYIMSNYIWFLGGAIIILLAIIGSYADKTNFGQGDKKEKKKPEILKDFNEKNIEEDNTMVSKDIKDINNDAKSELNKSIVDESNEQNQNVEPTKEDPVKAKVNKDNSNKELDEADKSEDVFENNFDKFNEEFNAILPKKEIISEELLDDIDNLSIESETKINSNDIPELSDVELPEIKELKSEDEDIWKF